MTDGSDRDFPSEEELPDEPVTLEDISPFTVDADDFDDVNAFSRAEWKATTTARERIQGVLKHGTSRKTVAEVAEEAAVSEKDARTILDDLVDEELVREHQTDTGFVYEHDLD